MAAAPYPGPTGSGNEPTPVSPAPAPVSTPRPPSPGQPVFVPDVRLDPSQVTDRRPSSGNVGPTGTVASAAVQPASDYYELPPLVQPYRPY